MSDRSDIVSFTEKYWMMFGQDHSATTGVEGLIQKKNSTQKKQEDSTEKTPNVTEQEQGQDSRYPQGSNMDVHIIVGITCGIVAVVVVVAVPIWLSYRCRRPTGSISLKGEDLSYIMNVLTSLYFSGDLIR